MSELTIRVPEMSCGHCEAAVSEAVRGVDGVADVRVDLESKRVEIEGAPLDPQAVAAAIREAGYDVEAS